MCELKFFIVKKTQLLSHNMLECTWILLGLEHWDQDYCWAEFSVLLAVATNLKVTVSNESLSIFQIQFHHQNFHKNSVNWTKPSQMSFLSKLQPWFIVGCRLLNTWVLRSWGPGCLENKIIRKLGPICPNKDLKEAISFIFVQNTFMSESMSKLNILDGRISNMFEILCHPTLSCWLYPD